jgi:hypothetical protein
MTKFIDPYPFPDIDTALTWPFFEDIDEEELSIEEIKELFIKNWKAIKFQACLWRSNIELKLANSPD